MQKLKTRFSKDTGRCDFATEYDDTNQVHLSALWGLWLLLGLAVGVAAASSVLWWAWQRIKVATSADGAIRETKYADRARHLRRSVTSVAGSFRRSGSVRSAYTSEAGRDVADIIGVGAHIALEHLRTECRICAVLCCSFTYAQDDGLNSILILTALKRVMTAILILLWCRLHARAVVARWLTV
jgi:hypothetical protein